MAKNRSVEVTAAVADVDLEKNSYQVQFDTSMGRIVLDLLPDVAPGHCRNMIGLARIGFYDGIIFHRVIKGFVIQAGCPEGRGTGGPGYTIDAEFNSVPHEAGVLSMARSSDPNSAGSQFFLCLGRVPHLDGKYTAFGRTADDTSLQVVLKIGQVATDGNDRPKSAVSITSSRVVTRVR